ncbi:MAG: hypothetical protein V7752_21620 [Halopseudomonas sp.]
MKNRTMLKELSRLRTSDLLVSKMDCTKSIARLKSIQQALIGLLGLLIGSLAKVLLTAPETMGLINYVSIGLVLYCVIGYWIVNGLGANSAARKELICDLLTLRMNRTGKKKA